MPGNVYMCLGKITEKERFFLNNILMENSKKQNILGVADDNNLIL